MTYAPNARVVSVERTVRDDQQYDPPGRYGTVLGEYVTSGPVLWDDGTTYVVWYGDLRPVMMPNYHPVSLVNTAGGTVQFFVCSVCSSLVDILPDHTFHHERQQPA